MRTVFMTILFLLPLFTGFVDNNHVPAELDEPAEPQAVIGSGNPLGWEWVEKDELAGYLWIREIEANVDGTSFVAGIFRGGSVHLGAHHVLNMGEHDVFIGKRNYDDKWVWLSSIGGTGDEYINDMVFDNANNLLIAGTTDSSTLSITTSSGTVTHTTQGFHDGFVSHINAATGTIGWFETVGGAGFDNTTSVSQSPNGIISVCGWSTSSTLTFNSTTYANAGQEDMFVFWMSSTGAINDGMMFGNTGREMIHDCKTDQNGKTVAVGEFSSSTLTLNQTTINHGGGTGSDSLVMRVSKSSGVEWVRMPIATANDRATSVVVDAAGNVFVAGEHFYNGSTSNSITWGSIQITTGGDYSMIYVVKISNVGAIGWALRSYMHTNNYGQNRLAIEPSLDLVGAHLGLSFQSRGYGCIYFKSGSTTYGCYSSSGNWGSMIVGISNIGTMSTANYLAHQWTAVYDFDAVENTTSSNDFVTSGWNNFPRTTSTYTELSDAPGGTLVRGTWETSGSSPGPKTNTPAYAYAGISGTEEVIDVEPISATQNAVLIYSKSQGLRFGQHAIGGTVDNKLILAIIDNNGQWISADQITFGRDRIDHQNWASNSLYNHNKMSMNMDVSPNGTVWVSFFWADHMEVPNIVQKTSGSGFGVVTWTSANGWETYNQINFRHDYYVANDITVDGLGNVYVLGACSSNLYVDSTQISTSSGIRTCVAYWDATSSSWDHEFSSNGRYQGPIADSIQGDPNGGAVLYDRGGYWNEFATGSSTYTEQSKGGLVRLYHGNGTATLLGEPSASQNDNRIRSLDVSTSGDVVLAGWFQGSISYPNCCSVNTGGSRDGMITFWNNTSMSWDWSISLGGSSNDQIHSVRFVGNQSIAVAGQKTGVISVGLTTLSASGTGFVAVASTAGSWEWAQQPEGSASINAIAQVSSQSILVAGDLHYQTTDHVFGLDSKTTSDGSDVFVARMSPDADADSITNSRDNCPNIYNPNQDDYDVDASGDLCDTDDDGDGILDVDDACPSGALAWTSNAASDHDTDGCQDVGEDSDDDEDGVDDPVDLCPVGDLNWTSRATPPSSRTDYDADGCRDSTEDVDDDNDQVNDTHDACPTGTLGWVSSPSTDADGDGCLDDNEDLDDDGDSVLDDADLCPSGALGWTSNASTDNDGDGCLDATEDLNDDNDDFVDIDDACPNGTVGWSSGRFTDYDGDGCFDAGEDTDDDADGVLDVDDNCPMSIPGWRTNPTVDLDGDGCHDWNEDWDDDGDGVDDLNDLCPRTARGFTVDSGGCASGESPPSEGGSSVTNNYQNTTYVNNTYQNDSYYNSSYLNETNQFENNSYQYENTTYENTTYENTTYENETFQNTTNMLENNASLEGLDNEQAPDQEGVESKDEGSAMSFIELAVVGLLVAIFIVQILMVPRAKQRPFSSHQEGGYQEMESDEFDMIKDEFDTKTLTDVPPSADEMSPSPEVAKEETEPAVTPPVEAPSVVPEPTAEVEDSMDVEEGERGEIESSEGPDEHLVGSVDENGYEWLEYPAGTGQNYYRIHGQSSDWMLWDGQS